MKNRCCFIIVYFGKLPNYFQLFLNSCSSNKNFNWLLFTDDYTKYRYPNNVKVEYISFNKMIDMINRKLDFSVKINTYHKLCDYKPAFGYLFEDYINDFQFWGHCDIDTIMGNLSHYLTDSLLEQYDKLFCLGHFILYRNTFDNNRIFMHSIEGEYWYKNSFLSESTTIFDETYGGKKNINTIFLLEGKRVLMKDWSMNCHIKPTSFVRTRYDAKTDTFFLEKKIDALYVWNNGCILRYYLKNKKLIEEEFMYIHLQSRNMMLEKNVEFQNRFIITENKFKIMKQKTVNVKNFNTIPRHSISLRYFKMQVKWNSEKLKKFFKKLKKV